MLSNRPRRWVTDYAIYDDIVGQLETTPSLDERLDVVLCLYELHLSTLGHLS